jgi:hypothetical protein
MKVFLSWSGMRSHQIATFLQGILKQVFEGVDFYLSSDMERGTRWSQEIFDAMDQCSVSIIVFTPENKFESWVMFEAGRLSRAVDSLVIPVYVDCEFHAGGPFREFQSVRLETQQKVSADADLHQNKVGLTRIIETLAGRSPVNAGTRYSLRLRHLTDSVWWTSFDSRLREAARIVVQPARPLDSLSASEPAEETPILAYPHYRSALTFDAMTRAVRETASTICLSSLGLFVYAKWAPFRAALNERVRKDASISLKVVLQDPASEDYVKQHQQMRGREYRDADLFVSNAYGLESDSVRRLPAIYYQQPALFGVEEILRFIPDNQALYHFAVLLRELNGSAKDRVSVRLYSGWFLNTVLMFDHVVYMFPYGVDHDALDAPLFRFLPGQIGLQYFRGQFQSVYERGREIEVRKFSTTGGNASVAGNLQ